MSCLLKSLDSTKVTYPQFWQNCLTMVWKVSPSWPVHKNMGEVSYLLQYCPISFFSVIILNLLSLSITSTASHKQYGFHYTRSTANVFSVTTYRISEALDNKSITFALDISKPFYKMWYRSCYANFPAMAFLVVFSTISFLLSSSRRVIINGQSSDIHEINAGVSL